MDNVKPEAYHDDGWELRAHKDNQNPKPARTIHFVDE